MGALAAAPSASHGISSNRIWSGDTRRSASSESMWPSLTIASAMRTAAYGARFAERVCRKYKRPRSTVNSMSCTSRWKRSSESAQRKSSCNRVGNVFAHHLERTGSVRAGDNFLALGARQIFSEGLLLAR